MAAEEASSALAREFLEFSLGAGLLRLGEFTTKSGRPTAYFFDTGRACGGSALGELARCYARAAQLYGLKFDSVFGSAYKGIPLAAALALELAREDPPQEVCYAFDRKEAKDHGEEGSVVGRLEARVLVVDDVITSGQSLHRAAVCVRSAGSEVAGVLVALDRSERAGEGANETAAENVRHELGVPVKSIATAPDLARFLEAAGRAGDALRVRRQLARYGAAA